MSMISGIQRRLKFRRAGQALQNRKHVEFSFFQRRKPVFIGEHLTRSMSTTETTQLYSAGDAPIQSGHVMARRRYSPSALVDPKVSVVIPVYNEKNTIDEILRRVLDTEPRKEVIVVDDCSTDGTKQILESMAARQANGEGTAPAQDGTDPIALGDLRFFFQAQNQGKGAALQRGFAQVSGDIVL